MMIEERLLPKSLAEEIGNSLRDDDAISQALFSGKRVSMFRVFAPASVTGDALLRYKVGGFNDPEGSKAAAIGWIISEMEANRADIIIFPDYLRRLGDKNDFLERSQIKFFEDEYGMIYLYVTAENLSYKKISSLIESASQYPRLGFLTNLARDAVKGSRRIELDAVVQAARCADTILIGMYDEETLGIISLIRE